MSHIVHIVRPPTDDYTLPSASPRPRHSKIRKSDASHLGNKTTKHNSIERHHITAVNTRTQDFGNELERKLTLSAARAVESAAVFALVSKRHHPTAKDFKRHHWARWLPQTNVSAERRSVLQDAQRSAVAVKTYENYEALRCETCNLGP